MPGQLLLLIVKGQSDFTGELFILLAVKEKKSTGLRVQVQVTTGTYGDSFIQLSEAISNYILITHVDTGSLLHDVQL